MEVAVERILFNDEHRAFRELARDFLHGECAPHLDRWETEGCVDRDTWSRAGELGLLGWEAPPEYGGLGITDYRYNAILAEE
jgi:acyl-CoA dehydrogenase